MKTLLLLGLMACACGQDRPDTFSIGPGVNVDVARDAFGAWCEAVGYCPAEVAWVDGAPGSVQFERDWQHSADDNGYNEGERIVLNPAATWMWGDAHATWFVLAHEVGHYGTDHLAAGLMAETQSFEAVIAMPLEIDDAAINAWH